MTLFKKGTKFEIDYQVLERKIMMPLIKMNAFKSVNNKTLLENIVEICNEKILEKKQPKDSFLIFGMILGHHNEEKEVDQIWTDCWKLYDGKSGIENKELFNFLSKILGTILMIQFCKDKGIWEFEPDPDKKQKISLDERPDAAIYNLRKRR